MTLRPATPEDAPGLARVQVAAWHTAYAGMVPQAELDAFTEEVREPRWRRILGDPLPGTLTLVLEEATVIQGFISVGPARDGDLPGHGEIWALYVHPDAWGAGRGRALLSRGLAALKEQGWVDVSLWVLKGNQRAQAVYRRFAFAADGHQKDEPTAQGARLQEIRMTRSG